MASKNSPVGAGSPMALARAPEGPNRLGPATAPTVAAVTTVLMARPRRLARSAAAYRANMTAALPPPSSPQPASNSGQLLTAAAATTRPAPTVPAR